MAFYTLLLQTPLGYAELLEMLAYLEHAHYRITDTAKGEQARTLAKLLLQGIIPHATKDFERL